MFDDLFSGVGDWFSGIDFGKLAGGLISGLGGPGSAAAAGIGGLIGAFGGGSSSGSTQPMGYQGGIPRYTANREVIPYPAEGRRPGEYGRQYFSPVTFSPMGGTDTAGGSTPAAQTPQNTAPDQNTQNTNIDYTHGSLNGHAAAAGGLIRYAAGGGISSLGGYADYAGGGRMLKGPGTGQSDSIPATIEDKQPARLARDEFVVPADVVSMLGDGSSDAGAERLYAMMDRIRKSAHGRTKQQNEIKPNKVLPA